MSEQAKLSIRLHFDQGASHAVDFDLTHDGSRAVIELYKSLIAMVRATAAAGGPKQP